MKLIGPNWKTTASAAGTAILATLTFLSSISYDQGPLALVIPPKYKNKVTMIAGISAVLLYFYNGIRQKDKDVTGGSVQQTIRGNYVEPGKQNLVDATVEGSPLEEKIKQ